MGIASADLLESQFARSIAVVDSDADLGTRVRMLRKRAGMPAKNLAEAVGLDPSALSNIERGKRAVKTDELSKIASALRVSPLALLEEDSLSSRIAVAPRDGGMGRVDGEAYKRLLALVDLHQILAEQGVDSNPRFGDAPEIDEAAWKRDATRLANWAREKLGPIETADARLPTLAVAIEEHLGVDVVFEAYPEDGLLGAAVVDASFPLIFVNASQAAPRAVFTLAHELGHVLARKTEGVKLDWDLRGIDSSERFANAFAAAFLMPEEDIRTYIAKHGRDAVSIAFMVHELGVSFQSLVYRLHNLGLISASGRDTLMDLGWNGLLAAGEDPNVKDRLPAVVRNSLRMRMKSLPTSTPPNGLVTRAIEGYRRGVLSVRPIAGLLGLDAEELLGVLSRDAASVLSEDYSPSEEHQADDGDFEGSPV